MSTQRNLARILVGFVRLVVPIAILAVGIAGAYLLIVNRPEVPRVERDAQATFVEVLPVTTRDEPISVTAYGTVEAARSVVVQPQVGGLVIEQNPELIRGGILPAGARLLSIDPRDYEYRVEQEKAAVARAVFDLKIEQGRQVVAQREWELLGESVEKSALGEDLALRRPHLEEKRAALESARSRLEQAELDLDRTRIEAPFHALVLEESVDVGQVVMPQNPIATLVDVSEFHVIVSLPAERLEWVRLPRGASAELATGAGTAIAGTDAGSSVRLFSRRGRDRSVEHQGRVEQLVGSVDPTGRMARLLVSVDDPLGVASGGRDPSPMLIGEYVRVEIEGPTLTDVVALPRRLLGEGRRVWVMDRDDLLASRQIRVLHGTETEVFVADDFEEGDRLVSSALSAPVPGIRLATLEAQEATEPGTAKDARDTVPADDEKTGDVKTGDVKTGDVKIGTGKTSARASDGSVRSAARAPGSRSNGETRR